MENICIDFGTCNTVISYYENGNQQNQRFVFNPFNGDILIPTTIFFHVENCNEEECKTVDDLVIGKHYVIGCDANNMNELTKGNNNCYFYQFKRFLGLTKSNNGCADFLAKFNVNHVLDDDTICFSIDGLGFSINIVQLVTLFFRGLKPIMQTNGIVDVLVTCPAYFHDLQRQQLSLAVCNAGFNIFKMCNEPTMALMKYFEIVKGRTDAEGGDRGVSNATQPNGGGTFIIFDLGGGTLDTTVVEYFPDIGICDVVDIYGDNALGGTDIDNLVAENLFQRYNIAITPKMKFKIKNVAEQIKIVLTTATTITICLEEVPLKTGKVAETLQITITRHEFNKMVGHLIDKMIAPVISMCQKHETNNVIFIGGPTQIPLVATKLEAMANVKQTALLGNENGGNANSGANNVLYKTIVAMGGSLFFADIKNKTKLVLIDIIPMDVGIAGNDDEMIVIIPKNSKFPISATRTFTTSYDGQRKIDIGIYEGTAKNIINNTLIGSYSVYGIPAVEKGKIIIDLTFQINENGLLNVFIDGKHGIKVNDNIKLIPQVVAKRLFKKLLEKVGEQQNTQQTIKETTEVSI
jgi:molecular chaperone DnaK (HSP70)